MRFRLRKHVADSVDEGIVCLIFATGVANPSHLFDESGRHQRLAHSRHAVQQNAARQLYPERRILRGILRHVAQLLQFFLFLVVADDFVKCAHTSTSLVFISAFIIHAVMYVFRDTKPTFSFYPSFPIFGRAKCFAGGKKTGGAPARLISAVFAAPFHLSQDAEKSA